MISTEEKMREIYAPAKHFSLKNGIIKLKVTLSKEKKIENLFLKQRNGELAEKIPFILREKEKGTHIQYCFVLDTNAISMKNGFWDIVATVKDGNETYDAILGGQSTWKKLMLIAFPRWLKTKDGHIVYPFINGERHFTIQYRERQKKYDTWTFIFKEYLALMCYFLLKPYWDRKKLWFICEKFCGMAQDNGFYFFKFCMEYLPENEKSRIFYVIDKKCSDYQAVKKYDKNVIHFMSFRYMILLNAAELLISSDAIRHFYIWDSPNTIYKTLYQVRKNIIFLQHGVMAFKQCHRTFHKYGGNRMALFVVSSEYEQDIINKYFEYEKDEIIITGLPRWDVLHSTATDDHKEILIMPTWRKWLENASEEEFLVSDYFRNYKELLENKDFLALLEKEDIYVNFYIHPKFRQHICLFAFHTKRIQFIPFGELPLNQLIMSCHMLVTDYSSVAWDVYYQEKPIVFYTFDRKNYEKKQGSYMDIEKDGFGDVTSNLYELISCIQYYSKNHFQEKKIFAEKREWLLPYRDNKNSKRIYEEIKERKFENKLKILKFK